MVGPEANSRRHLGGRIMDEFGWTSSWKRVPVACEIANITCAVEESRSESVNVHHFAITRRKESFGVRANWTRFHPWMPRI